MTGICLAYLVAAIAPNMDAANALLPTYVTICMYFGGLFLIFDRIPIGWYWFSWLSFLRYSWGAQMLNQFEASDPGKVGAFWDEDRQRTVTILEFYGMQGDIMGSTGACVALLALTTLVFAILGAVAVSKVRHGSR